MADSRSLPHADDRALMIEEATEVILGFVAPPPMRRRLTGDEAVARELAVQIVDYIFGFKGHVDD